MRQFRRNRTYALRPAHWLRKTSTGPLFKSRTAGWRSVCHGMETPEHWGFEPEEQDIHAGSERSQGSCAGNIGIGSIRDAIRWKVACGKGKVNLPLSPWEHTLKRNVDDSGKEIFCTWALDFCLHELAQEIVDRRPDIRGRSTCLKFFRVAVIIPVHATCGSQLPRTGVPAGGGNQPWVI